MGLGGSVDNAKVIRVKLPFHCSELVPQMEYHGPCLPADGSEQIWPDL